MQPKSPYQGLISQPVYVSFLKNENVQKFEKRSGAKKFMKSTLDPIHSTFHKNMIYMIFFDFLTFYFW